MGYCPPIRRVFASGLSEPGSPHSEIISSCGRRSADRQPAFSLKERPMPVGLLIVDIQNDYFPGGKWELEGSEKAGGVAGNLLTFFREHKMPVVHIQHVA